MSLLLLFQNAGEVAVAVSYANTSATSQSYNLSANTSLTYANGAVSSQSYGVDAKTNFAYSSVTTSDENVALDLTVAVTSVEYASATTSAQDYTIALAENFSYTSATAFSQNYALSFNGWLAFNSATVSSQTYVLSGAAHVQQPQNFGGGITHVASPKQTRQEKKNAKKAAKAHVVEQDKIDLLKAGIKIDVPFDPALLQQIEFARLQMEQELAARIEEEELQMVVVMALAHHRRNRFRHIAA